MTFFTTAGADKRSPAISAHVTQQLAIPARPEIAQVANWIVETIPCQVTCPPAIVASSVIRALSGKVALLFAVVAQSHITRWHGRSGTVMGFMTGLATSVAHAFLSAAASCVTRFTAVPTKRLCGAF
ncbi:hypothetical protein Dimus_002638 [Dionaea muscipula]